MIIQEKALIRQLKADFRAGGYRVAGITRNGKESLLIYDSHWLMRIERKFIPFCVLATIVSHAGTVPAEGEALRIRKGDIQNMLPADAESVVDGLDTMRKVNTEYLQKTPLCYKDTEIWQNPESLQVIRLDPQFTDMVAVQNAGGYLCGNAAWFCGQVSDIYIMPIVAKANLDKEALEHLSAVQWTAGK